jgi:hypothetical protein
LVPDQHPKTFHLTSPGATRYENILAVFAFFSLAAHLAIAQHAPTDAKILHGVDAALENERAFRGLLIVPKVSVGIVH